MLASRTIHALSTVLGVGQGGERCILAHRRQYICGLFIQYKTVLHPKKKRKGCSKNPSVYVDVKYIYMNA